MQRVETPTVIGDELRRHRLLVPVLVSIGMVVAVVSSLGSPMVPTVASTYLISLGNAQWTLTVTLLTGAVVTPVLGRMGDGPHRREVILGALAVITLGSLCAAIPGSFALLLLGRACQGVGLGLMPLAMSVARDHFPEAKASSTVAILSITAAAGVGLGYPISGLCAQTLGFHPTFLLAAAVSALVLVGAALTVPPSHHNISRRIDLVGAGLLAVALAGLVVALSEGTAWGLTSARFVGLLLFALVAFGLWTAHELTVAHPLVNLRTLTNRPVLTAQVAALLAGVGMYLLLSLVIRYIQTPTSTGYGLGRSVVVAGLVLVPFSISSLTVNRLLPIFRRWVAGQWVMPLGCLALMGAVLVFVFARSELWEFVIIMALAGVGVGTVFASMPMLIVSSVPAHETGSALGFNQVLRTVGGSIGSAVSAAVLTAHTKSGSVFPSDNGYTISALIGVAVWVVTITIVIPRRRAMPVGIQDADIELLEHESLDAGAAGAFIYELDRESSDVDEH